MNRELRTLRALDLALHSTIVARRRAVTALVVVYMSPCTLLAQQPTPGVREPPEALAERARAWCTVEAEDGEPALGDVALIGQVREADTGEPVPDVVVWIRPFEGEFAAVKAGPSGVYVFCGFPSGMYLQVQASAASKLSQLVTVHLPDRGVAVQDLEVSAAVFAHAEAERVVPGARLQGVVRSAETGEPLAGARVSLLELGADQLTGPDGAFFMEGVPLGRYRVVTEYLGMASDTVTVTLLGDVANLALFTLETRPIDVPALNVEVERTYASRRIQGFYDRMERGLGEFITAEDLDLSDVVSSLRRLPNVRVYQTGPLGTGWVARISRGYGLTPASNCPPLIYVDGMLITLGFLLEQRAESEGDGSFMRLQSMPRHMIEGIEVYRNPAGAPGQYRMIGDACGIILVWTKTRF